MQKSKKAAISSGCMPLNSVQLTLTRKPWPRARRIAATARWKVPGWSTARSCCASRPSRCTEKVRYLRRLEQVQLLLQQQPVGAQVDELPAGDDAGDDPIDLLVQQRLAAGDRDNRRAAFVDRFEALIHRQAAIEDRVLHSRSCRSLGTPDCSETAVQASAQADTCQFHEVSCQERRLRRETAGSGGYPHPISLSGAA